MKKKVAILGSTGSIGKNTLEIINLNRKNFTILLLSANSNYVTIKHQIKKYKPKYYVVNSYKVYQKILKDKNLKKTKVINNFNQIPKNIKFHITISAIVGIAGLEPTIQFAKKSKKILMANKESIICGWHIINSISEKYKTQIIPIDSEHFSINQLTKNYNDNDIKKILITASGGPFLRKPLKNFKNIKPKDASKHPNWKMGKKISIDSSNLMNKVLELIEAFRLFKFNPKKYEIVIHPQSLVHAIVIFKNGQSKLLYHETNMKIPIANAIYDNKINIENFIDTKKHYLKNLSFERVDKKRFPIVTLLNSKIYQNSGPIILNACNEILVDRFIKKEIPYSAIYQCLKRIFKDRDFKKYAVKKRPSIDDIYKIDKWARYKTVQIIKDKS
tara:strand:+ start:2767 stop:3930 length:1164 start_codon:yes stop_codon:yes gene_type:complete